MVLIEIPKQWWISLSPSSSPNPHNLWIRHYDKWIIKKERIGSVVEFSVEFNDDNKYNPKVGLDLY